VIYDLPTGHPIELNDALWDRTNTIAIPANMFLQMRYYFVLSYTIKISVAVLEGAPFPPIVIGVLTLIIPTPHVVITIEVLQEVISLCEVGCCRVEYLLVAFEMTSRLSILLLMTNSPAQELLT
jgi:hypothetical protein